MRLLLLSNSTNPGEEFLLYPRSRIADFLTKAVSNVLFVPFAAVTITYDDYADRVATALGGIGLEVQGVHRLADPVEGIRTAECIMIGGGNSFHLLYQLHRQGLIEPIRQKVQSGTPYIGWSAGSNVACPTIRTTNDMPIVEPATLDALGLVPFQINPHYTDAPIPNLRAETRDDRLNEFCLVNRETIVAGLREGTMLRVEGRSIQLLGSAPAKIFRFGAAPDEQEPDADLTFLFDSQAPRQIPG